MGDYKFQTIERVIFCNSTRPTVKLLFRILGVGEGAHIKVQIASVDHIMWRLAQLSICMPLCSDTDTSSLGKH